MENEIDEDYTRSKVPENKTVGSLQIISVIIGVGITLPVFFVGAEVSQSLGIKEASIVFFVVCFVLSILCIATAIIGNRSRLSTYMILHFSFGKEGAKIINSIVAITLLGWYAVTVEIFGGVLTNAFDQLLGWQIPLQINIIIGSSFMTLTAIFGFGVIEKFSMLAVPLMLAFMIFVLFTTINQFDMNVILMIRGHGDLSLSECISAIVGMVILTPVLMPDYSRFARTDKDSVISVSGLAIGFPIVLLAGGIPSLATSNTDIMMIMIGLSLTIPALFILIFATWTTNTANLYSSILTLSTVFRKTLTKKIGIIASIAGTSLALGGVTGVFIDFLNISSILIPPVSAIFIADFFFVSKQSYDLGELNNYPDFGKYAIISWGVSSVIAYLGWIQVFTITSVSFFDSFLIAFSMYMLLSYKKVSIKRG